ncbi:hypothetical protein K438DRAFT_1752542 [Mycena galopus ATCC 62051]|nr:hypothetical protein K438DRAFT_1752542 [Mycena galopus ATCC 62051]
MSSLSVRFLKLKAVAASPDDVAAGSEEVADVLTWTWLWMQSYLMGKSAMKGTQITTDAPHLISVAGHLVDPVTPKAVMAQEQLSADDMQHINSMGTTWAIDHNLLGALIDELWKRVELAQLGLREMPFLKEQISGFPYSWTTGLPALTSAGGTAFIAQKSAADPCLYCPEIPSNWRGHMGGHIIRKLRNTGESKRDKAAKRMGNATAYPRCYVALQASYRQLHGNYTELRRGHPSLQTLEALLALQGTT